jgi:hypothetical protein
MLSGPPDASVKARRTRLLNPSHESESQAARTGSSWQPGRRPAIESARLARDQPVIKAEPEAPRACSEAAIRSVAWARGLAAAGDLPLAVNHDATAAAAATVKLVCHG